ncbi:hypothetical protein GGQ22_19815 [Nocardioides sp. zg-579]|uniref:Uncharacterized protein n=1 Tax=Nocardioides marmotae TaxID=2663857 RepID=A0A6I3JGM4_9ACTN|nr:hypothetical protein [Nocardioides marmotae]MCR6033659.1 hypothetical protein [Gordonia jinghuaiqii]MTB97317.1 hypothetical protein [Nocardioides marmotae]QKE01782.1 hypothetical protein HPC71_12430 [Nocardioides marmotae]
MATPAETVAAIEGAPWNQRVNLVRQIPEAYGLAAHRDVYATLARELYVPKLTPDFAYVLPRSEYDLPPVAAAYREAHRLTGGFTKVGVSDVAGATLAAPVIVAVWRLLLGYIWREFAAATQVVGAELDLPALSADRLKKLEQGVAKRSLTADEAQVIAEVVVRGIDGSLWPVPEDGRRTKQDRPDLAEGWATVRQFATDGVPFEVFLHQRHYGGAFRQLLDAIGTQRGDVLEQELEDECERRGIRYIRTGAHNQAEVQRRFNLTVKPAPDFVFFDASDTLQAILEVKLTNDGGTARDKAARFAALRTEAGRLGGKPLFALLDGLGWTRTSDALGPVVRDCDGRVFTRGNLAEMFDVDPFPHLATLGS